MSHHHFTRTFNIDDTAVVLIDHQVGTCSWVHSIDTNLLEKNVRILATFATEMGMPLVLTSSMETNVQGLLMDVIQKSAPKAYAERVKRQGIVNAWTDPNFANAVRATGWLTMMPDSVIGTLIGDLGKKNLIVAGVTTDVCLVPPTVSMQAEGFHVKAVLDAGGSPTEIAERAAWERLKQAEIPLTSTNAMVTELIRDWSTEAGQKAFPLLA